MGWRNGSAGYKGDLIEFYRENCQQSKVLKVRSMSYRSPRLPIGGVSHLKVDGELELSVEGESLFGFFTLKTVNPEQNYPLEEDRMRVFREATTFPRRLHIYQLGNYSEQKISLYSGDPGDRRRESWSFHCELPVVETH